MHGVLSQAFPAIRGILTDIIGDPTANEQITYRRYKKQEYDDDLGYVASSYDDFPDILALRLKHNAKSASLFNASIQEGDDVYIIEDKYCPGGMSLKDLIVDADAHILKVADIKPVFDLAKIITIEGGGIQK